MYVLYCCMLYRRVRLKVSSLREYTNACDKINWIHPHLWRKNTQMTCSTYMFILFISFSDKLVIYGQCVCCDAVLAFAVMQCNFLPMIRDGCRQRYWDGRGAMSPTKSSREGWGMRRSTPPSRLGILGSDPGGAHETTPESGVVSWAPLAGSGAETQPETHFGVFWKPQHAPFCTCVPMLWVRQTVFHVILGGKADVWGQLPPASS